MSKLRRLWLFIRIVWRKFDNPDIPAPYRNDGRISVATAWEVARIVWP